jgi:GR25 family glycosyltransferase involved in LPS biosynthesis
VLEQLEIMKLSKRNSLLVGYALISLRGAEGFSANRLQIVRQIRPTSTTSSLPSAVLDDIDITSEVQSNSFSEERDDVPQQVTLVSPNNDWDFVDKVYLITCPNADPGSARLDKAKTILDKVGLLERVEVKEFDTDDEDRIRGCYMSHISVLKDGMRDIQSSGITGGSQNGDDWLGSLLSMFGNNSDAKKKAEIVSSKIAIAANERPKCIMVLEDNLEFTGNLNAEILNSVSRYLGNSGADIIHLSYIPYVPNLIVSKTEDKNIVALSTGQSSALGTTAYVITEKAMEILIQEDAKNGFRAPIPDVMAEQFPNSRFSAYPNPFLRAPKTKSLVNPQLDSLREILFQPAVVSQVQSVLAMTGLSTNSLLFITVGALLAAGGVGVTGVVDAGNQFISTGSYDGNLFFLVVNIIFTTCALGIIAQGAALAPKPPAEVEEVFVEAADNHA